LNLQVTEKRQNFDGLPLQLQSFKQNETTKIKIAILQSVIAAYYTTGHVARVLALSANVRLSVSDMVRIRDYNTGPLSQSRDFGIGNP
jgi:hypothetical protein